MDTNVTDRGVDDADDGDDPTRYDRDALVCLLHALDQMKASGSLLDSGPLQGGSIIAMTISDLVAKGALPSSWTSDGAGGARRGNQEGRRAKPSAAAAGPQSGEGGRGNPAPGPAVSDSPTAPDTAGTEQANAAPQQEATSFSSSTAGAPAGGADQRPAASPKSAPSRTPPSQSPVLEPSPPPEEPLTTADAKTMSAGTRLFDESEGTNFFAEEEDGEEGPGHMTLLERVTRSSSPTQQLLLLQQQKQQQQQQQQQQQLPPPQEQSPCVMASQLDSQADSPRCSQVLVEATRVVEDAAQAQKKALQRQLSVEVRASEAAALLDEIANARDLASSLKPLTNSLLAGEASSPEVRAPEAEAEPAVGVGEAGVEGGSPAPEPSYCESQETQCTLQQAARVLLEEETQSCEGSDAAHEKLSASPPSPETQTECAPLAAAEALQLGTEEMQIAFIPEGNDLSATDQKENIQAQAGAVEASNVKAASESAATPPPSSRQPNRFAPSNSPKARTPEPAVRPSELNSGGSTDPQSRTYAAEVGHSLRPPELGKMARVAGDGWGGGDKRKRFEGTITEADQFTFTVIVKGNDEKWAETHVLREHCVVLEEPSKPKRQRK